MQEFILSNSTTIAIRRLTETNGIGCSPLSFREEAYWLFEHACVMVFETFALQSFQTVYSILSALSDESEKAFECDLTIHVNCMN